ncbi:amidohydrolase [Lachnospiraceae bacterium NSJ-143]|nr:amidohydrolase [Lachnospiraceae bacterium NSJ-143]
MDIVSLAKKYQDEIIAVRRHLHENPEISQQEFNTVKFICSKLTEYGIDYVEVEKGGVLGFIGGSNDDKTVMLRADMDALPVEENRCNLKQPKSCVSKIPGISHACGHDSHVAMLLAAGKILKENEKEVNGRIILFFERAEEAGGNILYLLRYLYENKVRIDGCFGMHVKGSIDAGKLSIEKDGINAGGFGFEVTIKGRGGHGSAPSRANSPIDCFVALYNALSIIPTKYIAANEACSFSLGKVVSGSKRNIIPSELEFAGSMRFFKHDIGVKAKQEFLRLLDSISKAYQCEYEVTKSVGPTLPLVNNSQCTDIARESALKVVESDCVISAPPEMGSESFSAAQRIYPGVYAFLGIKDEALGIGAANHSPEFDIDESVLYIGTALEVQYALDFLNSSEKIEFTGYNGSPDDLYREICYKVD